MKKFLFFLVLIPLFISCNKEEIGNKVSITGFVKLINEQGDEIFDKNKVTVTIEGTSSSTKTDNYGKFLFKGLKAGKPYAFVFSKDSFGTISSAKYQFVGDAKPGVISIQNLYKLPTIEVSNTSIEFKNNDILIKGEMSLTSNYRIRCFANDSVDVSNTHYDYASFFYSGSATYPVFDYFSSYIDVESYKPGTTYYVAVYFFNCFDTGYYDGEKKQTLYSSAKKVTTLKITL